MLLSAIMIVVPSPLLLTMLSCRTEEARVVTVPLAGSYLCRGTQPEPAKRELTRAAPSPPKATAKVPLSPKAIGKDTRLVWPVLRSIRCTQTFDELAEESATIKVFPSGDRSMPMRLPLSWKGVRNESL